MSVNNPFARIAREVNSLPSEEKPDALAEAVGHAIPFVGTAGVTVEKLSSSRVEATLSDDSSVHNHIGGMHAGAVALLAETVTGLVVAINVQDQCVPVLRTLEVNYRKQVKGGLHAVAEIADADVERIQSTEIGRLEIVAEVFDDADNQPITNRLEWAWLPKRKAMERP